MNIGFSPTLSEPEWLRAKRELAHERFKATGFPTRRDESWKYTHLDNIVSRDYAPASLGVLTTDLHKTAWAEKYLALESTPETNPFVHLNTAQFQEGLFVRIPKNTSEAKPFHIKMASRGNDQKPPAYHPRVLIVVEAASQCEIVLDYDDQNAESYFMNSVIEFVLEPNATLSCSIHQQATKQAVQFMNIRARLAEGSRLDITGLTTGGSIIRNDLHIDLDGANAFCSLAGLSVLEGRSQAFQHISVNHRFLNCTSRQVYKNILAGDSVAEFDSLVHVWRCAQKSDSEQIDKNLLLSDGARVYSRPQLRIDNDDVRASHGAATGQMEKDELFYLQSRGIPKDVARFLLIHGFAQEVLNKVKQEDLRKEWGAELETHIRELVLK